MKNLAFHSLLRWKMILLSMLTTSLNIRFSLYGDNVLFELGSERNYGNIRLNKFTMVFRGVDSYLPRFTSSHGQNVTTRLRKGTTSLRRGTPRLRIWLSHLCFTWAQVAGFLAVLRHEHCVLLTLRFAPALTGDRVQVLAVWCRIQKTFIKRETQPAGNESKTSSGSPEGGSERRNKNTKQVCEFQTTRRMLYLVLLNSLRASQRSKATKEYYRPQSEL